MKEIKLPNRDGADLKLVNTKDNIWKFEVDSEHEFVLTYLRIIGKEFASNMEDPNNWEALDPSGGPFLSIGDKLDDLTIKGFTKDFELILE